MVSVAIVVDVVQVVEGTQDRKLGNMTRTRPIVKPTRKRGRSFTGALAAAVLGMGLFAAPAAWATPSEADVEQAKQEVEYAELSVAQLEVQLAAVAQAAEEASVAAAKAAEAANAAQVRYEEAQETAKKAAVEAKEAKAAFAQGLREFASVAQVASRGGTTPLDSLIPYLDADGLRGIEQRRYLVSSFGIAADNQMQQVAALKQVADLMDKAAEKAEKSEEDAYKQATQKAEAAESAAQSAQTAVADATAARQAMLEELAAKRQTSVKLERERLEAAEKQREQEALEQLMREESAANTQRPESSEGSSSNPPASSSTQDTSRPSSPSTSTPSPSTPSPSTPSTSAPAPSPAPAPKPTPKPNPPASGVGSSALGVARGQLGKPYVWGASGPNTFDCSGLTYWSFAQTGKMIPRVASSQYYAGQQVPFSQARAGDLIFWSDNGGASGIYHVAFYLGGGQLLHSPKPGDVVRVASLYNTHKLMPYAVRL